MKLSRANNFLMHLLNSLNLRSSPDRCIKNWFFDINCDKMEFKNDNLFSHQGIQVLSFFNSTQFVKERKN